MRIFGSERIDGMLQRLGLQDGEAIIHPWVNKALEKAQQKVEARNFDIRKNLLKYDDVMNDQRKVIYEQRREMMHAEDVSATVADMRHSVDRRPGHPPHPAERLCRAMGHRPTCTTRSTASSRLGLPIVDWAKEEGIADEEIAQRLADVSRPADGRKGGELRSRTSCG